MAIVGRSAKERPGPEGQGGLALVEPGQGGLALVEPRQGGLALVEL